MGAFMHGVCLCLYVVEMGGEAGGSLALSYRFRHMKIHFWPVSAPPPGGFTTPSPSQRTRSPACPVPLNPKCLASCWEGAQPVVEFPALPLLSLYPLFPSQAVSSMDRCLIPSCQAPGNAGTTACQFVEFVLKRTVSR